MTGLGYLTGESAALDSVEKAGWKVCPSRLIGNDARALQYFSVWRWHRQRRIRAAIVTDVSVDAGA